MPSLRWILSLFTFLLVTSIGLIDSRAIDPRCQPMRIPWCSGAYDAVIFPNFLGHQTQEEAYYAMHKMWPLIQTQCSPQILHYLCRLYAPQCPFVAAERDAYFTYHPEQYRPPCEDACLRVRHDCHETLWRHQIHWPAELECHNLRHADCVETPTVEIKPTEPPTPAPEPTPVPIPEPVPVPVAPEPEPEPETTTQEPVTTEEVTEPATTVEESSEAPSAEEETTTAEPAEETSTITTPGDGVVEVTEADEESGEETTTKEATTEATTVPQPEPEPVTEESTTAHVEETTEAPTPAPEPEPEPSTEETTTEGTTEGVTEATTEPVTTKEPDTTTVHDEPEPIAPDTTTGSLLGITPVIQEEPATPDDRGDVGSGEEETTTAESTTTEAESEVGVVTAVAVDAAEEPSTHAASAEEETTSNTEETTTSEMSNVLEHAANVGEILEATMDPQATEESTTLADMPAQDSTIANNGDGSNESPRSDRATGKASSTTSTGMLLIYLVALSLIFHGGA